MTQLRLIWTGLVISTFIYCLIVWMLFGKAAPSGTIEAELHQPIILVLMLLSFAMFAGSFALGSSMPDEPARRRARYIVRWAIIESTTIYGLIATFLTKDWRLFAIGWALSLIGFALAFPSAQEA
jgi:hypothetical protein